MIRVALLGCGKSKAARTCPASEMYRSALFRSSLRWAIQNCDRWFILSAKHGLLAPETIIEPYELSLASFSTEEREAWGRRVGKHLDEALPYPEHHDAEIVVLAGERYADAIDLGDRELYWEEPLRGLGIGQRLAWLKARRSA